MSKLKFLSLCATALLAASVVAHAGEADKIRAGVTKLLPGMEPDSIEPSPVAGLYEVTIGPRVLYVSADGKYLVQGRIYDMDKREDITEPKQAQARMTAVEKIGEDKMVIFEPDEYDHTITVFTDIECGYCRKLHREIEQYGEEGIRVRYVFFPRAGVDSASYKEAVAVWCADDRQQAMTDAKQGKKIDMRSCENPVKDHMQLGELLGISGTPAILLEDGELVPGYVPPKRLTALFNGKDD